MRPAAQNPPKEVMKMAMLFLEIVAFLAFVSSERTWDNVMEQEEG